MIRCSCGAKLKKSKTNVKFYGIDFGVKDCEICEKCGTEYLDTETMKEIEAEVKKKGLFALEKKIEVTRSGNSLVIRVPANIAKFLGIHYKSVISFLPVEKKRAEIKVLT